MRRAILLLSAAGVLLFGGAFALSFSNPLLIESAMREVVRNEVQFRVQQRMDRLDGSSLVRLAERALGQNRRQLDTLRAELPGKVAAGVADMLRAECPCRQRLGRGLQALAQTRLASLAGVQERLTGLIHTAYAEVATRLLLEFRVFTGTNALAFIVLGGLALARRHADRELGLAAVMLAGSVLITSGFYLFGQNWLHTILFSDYVGMAYAGWLIAVAALFGDLLFNRARVTSQMLNVATAVVVAPFC